MKRLTLIITAAIVLFCSFGTKAVARNDEDAAKVEKAVDELTFHIDVNTILPMGGSSIMDSGYYYLEFKDGHVKSYLPFIGESHGAVSPGEDSSLSFDEQPEVKVDKTKAAKKGEYTLRFQAQAPSAKWDVTVTLFNNGGAIITCFSTTKSQMTYWGDIDFETK